MNALTGTLGDYLQLSKPRIIVLLLVTTLAAMVMAARGLPPLALVFWTLLAGALAAGSAGAFNCAYDADIDKIMKRTAERPIPCGRISVRAACIYASVIGAASFGIFFFLVNPLAAWLSLAGNVYYVLIYTMWLKRTTPLNIVIGGAAGAVPPLVGWAAVTHSMGAPALGLFALIFLWTPPHFWSLALNRSGEYALGGIPMLPVVAGSIETRRQILMYSVILVPISLLPWALGFAGTIYGAVAGIAGATMILLAWQLRTNGESRPARRLFVFSIFYLFVLFTALLVDAALIRGQSACVACPVALQNVAGICPNVLGPDRAAL